MYSIGEAVNPAGIVVQAARARRAEDASCFKHRRASSYYYSTRRTEKELTHSAVTSRLHGSSPAGMDPPCSPRLVDSSNQCGVGIAETWWRRGPLVHQACFDAIPSPIVLFSVLLLRAARGGGSSPSPPPRFFEIGNGSLSGQKPFMRVQQRPGVFSELAGVSDPRR